MYVVGLDVDKLVSTYKFCYMLETFEPTIHSTNSFFIDDNSSKIAVLLGCLVKSRPSRLVWLGKICSHPNSNPILKCTTLSKGENKFSPTLLSGLAEKTQGYSNLSFNKANYAKTQNVFFKHNTKLSAGNFKLSTKVSTGTKNVYTKWSTLPQLSEHVPEPNQNLNDEDFGYFLAGLIESDGWFGINKELHIAFSMADISLAYFIKKKVGYGNIYPYTGKNAVRYICKNRQGMLVILKLINGKLVSNPKYLQLTKHHYSDHFGITILKPSNLVSFENYWLAGFVQGDGCFYISVVKSKTHVSGYRVTLEISIKQKDKVPLQLLFDLIKLGSLSQDATGS